MIEQNPNRTLRRAFNKAAWSTALAGFIVAAGSCSNFNNPFNPRSEIDVLGVEAGKIEQSFAAAGGLATYKITDPKASLEIKAPLPRVLFREAEVDFRLAGFSLPRFRTPVYITLLSGGAQNISLPVLSLDGGDGVINAAFPNNTVARADTGTAIITLYGVDGNGNDIETTLSAPIQLTSNVPSDGKVPLPFATPTPAPSVAPVTPTPTAAP